MPMGVVVAKDGVIVAIARMVGVADRPSLLATACCPNLEVLSNINDNISMTENIPRNLTGFWGYPSDLECMANYKWIIFYHSQHYAEVVFEVVPTVLFRCVQGSSGPRSHAAT